MRTFKSQAHKALKKSRLLANRIGFTGFAAIASLVMSGVLLYSAKSILDKEGRKPSSEVPMELSIGKISLPSGSHFKKFENVMIRVSFGETPSEVIEFFREKPLTLLPNQSQNLDLSLELAEKWTEQNKAIFRVEIVQLGFVEQVLLRCKTAATELSSYNRSFTCSHPKENAAILSYRLGTKGSQPVSKTAVAKID